MVNPPIFLTKGTKMKDPLNKKYVDDIDLFHHHAHQQQNNGVVGNQFTRKIFINKDGRQQEMGTEFSGLKEEQDGMPTVYNEEITERLSCGHIATPNNPLSAQCDFGHLVCEKCGLHDCPECRKKFCDRDRYMNEDGVVVCSDHESSGFFFPMLALIVFLFLMAFVVSFYK